MPLTSHQQLCVKFRLGFTAIEMLFNLLILSTSLVLVSHWTKRHIIGTQVTAEVRSLQSASQRIQKMVTDGRQPSQLQEEDYPIEWMQLNKEKPLSQLWIWLKNPTHVSLATCWKISRQIGLLAGCVVEDGQKNLTLRNPLGLWNVALPDELIKPSLLGQVMILQTVPLSPVTSAHVLLPRFAQNDRSHPAMQTDINLQQHSLTFKPEKPDSSKSPIKSEFNSQQWKFQQGNQQALFANQPQDSAIILQEDFKEQIANRLQITPKAINLDQSIRFGESKTNMIKIHKFLFIHFDNYLYFRPIYLTTQLHQAWNKIPYHEIADKELSRDQINHFADKICQSGVNNSNNHYQAFGRLFIIGKSSIDKPSTAFICTSDSNGIKAFPWYEISGYSIAPSQISVPEKNINSKFELPTPNKLNTAGEAKVLLKFLYELSENINFFLEANLTYYLCKDKDYSNNKFQQSSKKRKNVQAAEDKFKKLLKIRPNFKHTRDEFFNYLYEKYCTNLFNIIEKNSNDNDLTNYTFPELVVNYKKNKHHETHLKSTYAKFKSILNIVDSHDYGLYSEISEEIISKFKNDYNGDNQVRTKNFLTSSFNTDPYITEIVRRLVDLREEYKIFFKKNTDVEKSTQSNKIRVILPNKIDTIEQAEEILSFLIIISQKIIELIESRTEINTSDDFYSTLFEIKSFFREKIVKKIINFNEKPKNRIQLFRKFIKIYSDHETNKKLLYKFKKVLKENEKKIPSSIRSEVCDILQETVNQYYSDSQLIRIDGDDQPLITSPAKN